jgi:hypothetical protein
MLTPFWYVEMMTQGSGYTPWTFGRIFMFWGNIVGSILFMMGLVRLLSTKTTGGYNSSTVESDLARVRFEAEIGRINDKS